MEPKDYSTIMNMPEDERQAVLEEERKRVYAAGGEARTALAYLEGYFVRKNAENFTAFANLPRDSGLNEYQAVHSNLLALIELKADLDQKITAADRMVAEPIVEETEVNI